MEELIASGIKAYRPNIVMRYCPLFCFIPLSNGMVATVDPEEWIRLHNYEWHAKKTRGGWYAYRKTGFGRGARHIYMSREITNAPKGVDVHHKNGMTLFNVKENLEHIDPVAHGYLTRFRKIQHRQ